MAKKNLFVKRLEKITRHRWFIKVIPSVMSWIMRFSYYTTRWTIVGKEIPAGYHREGRPFIVCHWHDRLMVTPCVWCWKKPLHVLASSHRDGRLIASIVKKFHMKPVFGSTGKGVAAAKTLVRLAKSGEYVAIIPDGPRGPRHNSAAGIAVIPQLAQTDVIPFSCCVKRFFCFNSWDKFIWVWPFNRGVMVWGDPITPEQLKGKDEHEARRYIDSQIDAATMKAKQLLDQC